MFPPWVHAFFTVMSDSDKEASRAYVLMRQQSNWCVDVLSIHADQLRTHRIQIGMLLEKIRTLEQIISRQQDSLRAAGWLRVDLDSLD